MPQYNEYDPASAADIDNDDIMLWEANGVTYRMTAEELAKRNNVAVINLQSGTSYSLQLSDMGKTVLRSNASSNTTTVPNNTDVPFPIGTQIAFWRTGSGESSIVAGSGVTIRTANDDLIIPSQYASGIILKIGTNEWIWTSGGASSGGGSTDTTAPTVLSAVAIDDTHIEIIFSENVTVTTAGWSFKKNGSNLAISSVSGSADTWVFTVATMAFGDTILRSYNSTTGATVDDSANELATFTDQAVTNTVGDLTTPTLSSAIIATAQPNRVVLTYSETLNSGSIPANGQFVVSVNGVDRSTTSVTISGAVVNVNFNGAAVTSGQTVVIDYAVPVSNPLEDSAGNNAAALLNQAVTNSVTSTTDTDATALITYIESTLSEPVDSTEEAATHQLFIDLKASSNPFSKVLEMNLMIGGTVGRTLDAMAPSSTTYRIVPGVGCVIDSLGVLTDGVNDYFKNGVRDATLPLASCAVAFYNGISRAGNASKYAFGDHAGGGGWYFNLRNTSDQINGHMQSTGDLNWGTNTDTKGTYIFNHRVTTPGVTNTRRGVKNGTVVHNVPYDPVGGPPVQSNSANGFYYGTFNSTDSPSSLYDNCRFGIIIWFDSSLTDAEETQVTNAINTFITTLGRDA